MSAPHRMNAPRRIGVKTPTMFPHTVTLYTTTVEYDDNYTATVANHITVLRGVLLDATKAANVRATGLEGADAVDLYVPFSVEAVDGITGEKREYISPADFFKLDSHKDYWTLPDLGGTTSGKSTSWYFVKGEVVEPDKDREFMERTYDNVFSITKVDTKDFGDLQHWQIGGV